ncbi:MAG: putative quinol monooxygenase [Pseudomonadota bacterium]
MIVITGEIELHPEDAWPAAAAALKMMEASAREDGCLTYRIYTDLVNPRRFRLYEEWRDQASLDAHFATPHMTDFQESMKGFRILDRRIKKFEVGEVEAI